MGYQKLFGWLGISAIAILISGSPTLSQESDSMPEETEEFRPPFEVRLVPPAPSASGGGCFSGLKDSATFEKNCVSRIVNCHKMNNFQKRKL